MLAEGRLRVPQDPRRDERLLPLELVGLARRVPAVALGGDAVLKSPLLHSDGRAELVELLDNEAGSTFPPGSLK